MEIKEMLNQEYIQLCKVTGDNVYLLKNLTGIVFREDDLQQLFDLFAEKHGNFLYYKDYTFYKVSCSEGNNLEPIKIGDFYSVLLEGLNMTAKMLISDEASYIEEIKKIQSALNNMKNSVLTKEMVLSLSSGTLSTLMKELGIANYTKYVVIDRFKATFIEYCNTNEWRFRNWVEAFESFKEVAVNAYVDSFLEHWNRQREQGLTLARALESYFAA